MLSTNKILLVLCLFLYFTSCKNKSTKIEQTLSTLDLKRGELLLCGDPNFGEVSFALSCRYELRDTFNLGLSLIHSFEYAEAEKAFVRVLDQDPECLMAYWGTAMSILNHPLTFKQNPAALARGEALLKIAHKLTANNAREQDYIDAVSIYFKDWQTLDTQTRKKNYEYKMATLYAKYPNDLETAIFYSLSVLASSDLNDKTYRQQKKSGKILEDLFISNPNHPGIAHYIIHNYDAPELANLALTTARKYATIAPASSHAQHMPSHIFTRLGLWNESINSNIDSANAAICYAESVNPDATWVNEIHAMDYLVYAYLQVGDNENAQAVLDKIHTIKTVFPINNLAAAYALIAVPARIAIENKNWKLASQLKIPETQMNWNEAYWSKAMLHFSRALGFSNTNNPKAAEKELDILITLRNGLIKNKDSYAAGQVTIQINATKAWIEFAKGNSEKAITFMQLAVALESKTSKAPVTPGELVPASELLGNLYLASNQPEKALETYKLNLELHPLRFNGIYGAAKAASELNKTTEAIYYFDQLVRLSTAVKSNRPEVAEAKAFLKNQQT